MPGFTVLDSIDVHGNTRWIGGVEAPDPCLYGAQQARLTGHRQNCVSAGYRLEFDDILAKSTLLGIQYLFQFSDDRLWIAILNGENSDRLPTHPIDVEAQRRINGCATLGATPLNKQHVACGIDANRSGFGGKAVEQLD